MEDWLKINPMLAVDRYLKMVPSESCGEISERLIVLEKLSSTHIAWFTHKNPYGCWICDLISLNYATLGALESYLKVLEEPQKS